MAPGTAERVEFPHNGHDVYADAHVYDADGSLVHQNTYFSSLSHRQRHHRWSADRRARLERGDRRGGAGGTGDAPPAGAGDRVGLR